MKSNAPDGYKCPICLSIQGIESSDTLLKQADTVYKDNLISVFINSFWIGKNEGHVIVVPNEHFETIYELPEHVGHRVFDVAKKIAIAMKIAYQSDGITTRQNNEPAGDQHAFHFHFHIFPRYTDDGFNQRLTEKSRLSEPSERIKYVEKLKTELNKHL